MKYYIKFSILFLLFTSFLLAQEIQKVEPPFWWVGMHNPKLQLLIYGENISEYVVNISDKEVILDSVTKTENPNYLFLNLDFSKVKQPKKIKINLVKKGRKNLRIDYELKPRAINSANRNSFDSSDVIYLIMADRFANGNPKNDSLKDAVEKVDRTKSGGRHGGDIQGIINNLDYIKDLGATVLWSTPLLEDNELVYSYHTYAQSDYYKIDPRYGTNDDYKLLADALHQRDMKLIMDYVTNHWGSKHWMIQDLPTANFINQWPEGFQRSNYRMTTQFDSNTSLIDAEACMNGWFDITMPDMNQRNPLLLNYITQNAIWWIEYAGLDGLRVDTYSYNDKEGIAKWTKAITDEYPNFNIVGEIWMHDQAQIAYWQKDSKIGAIQNYNSHLPSVMDFTLYDELISVFNKDKSTWNDGIIKVYENFANDFLYPDIDNILVFAGNHDTNRINEIYQNDLDKYKMIMTLILTIRGIPQLYYGDEIGMLGNKDKLGDGDIRRDFPGGWPNDSQSAFTQNGRTQTQESYHAFTKKLLHWRKDNEAIHNGKTLQYIPENNVYVYFRIAQTGTVMLVINNNIETQNLDLLRFAEGIKKFTKGEEIISGNEISLQKQLTIAGKKSMIIELQ
ncbi:MAG: glycoside hydrolase family 13 protein [Flavobacteriaceae bacterium]|nr:glycoside hydrolase family 13 protein [Flavobacteriaceae bacterium]